jgi:hypothetical protein
VTGIGAGSNWAHMWGPDGSEVGCDARGPDGRAAARSGVSPGGGEVERTAGR